MYVCALWILHYTSIFTFDTLYYFSMLNFCNSGHSFHAN